MFRKSFLWLFVLVALVGMACNISIGGGDVVETPVAPTPEVESEATPEVEPAKTLEPLDAEPQSQGEPQQQSASLEGAVTSVSDAENAIIQIEAQGTFIDPQVGLVLNGAGRGSGFIIDPSGIAVTNNHVVTGAALIKVRLAGEDEWRNAKILGVSECSDLAVIDIDGDGFPYLSWYNEDIDTGMEMYVAGFPLGDPEYTLTKGVISKAQADGETQWASVDSVIEYDATTNPGNSGGPVINSEGQIIGVHYMGNPGTRQAYGISRDTAMDVIERLRSGENVDSIGINGQAVATEDGSLTGIWVSSVQSGSPADKSGIAAGDILFQLENLVLGTDGTMSDYCDILRSHQPTDTMQISVIRWASGELLDGQLNGRELAVSGLFETGDTTTTEGTTTSDVTSSGEYNFEAAASGDVAFVTDFDGDLSDWTYFLTQGEDDGFFATVENSTLHFEIEDKNTWIYLLNDQIEMSDVRIDTIAENLGRNNNNVSLICRYSDRGWYEFNVANNGEYTILSYDSRSNSYNTLFTGGSLDINTGLGTNEYTAVCSGNELSLYINGVETRTVTDNTFKSGLAGLSVSSFNVTPIVVDFDYFILSIP